MHRSILPATLALALAAVSAAGAATYHGRSVDGRWYSGAAVSNDAGAYENLQIRFDGERALVRFPAGGQLVLILDDEALGDPHHIDAYDYKHGIAWTLDVVDLAR